jgi:GTP cyclohydrolase I
MNKKIDVSEQDILNATTHMGNVLNALNIDWENNPHMKDTPKRVIKSWVNDLMSGLFTDPPNVTSFENDEKYDGMVCQTNIPMVSLCAHHLLSFSGYAHVAYIPSRDGQMIGLSKLNRIVDHISRRPSVQESLTKKIHETIDDVCKQNKGVAVMIEANHSCCSARGIKHPSTMRTARVSGAFHDLDGASRAEFYKFVEFAQNNRGVL